MLVGIMTFNLITNVANLAQCRWYALQNSCHKRNPTIKAQIRNIGCMKWCFLTVTILIALSSNGQGEFLPDDKLSHGDTAQVEALIKLSKDFQWIDAYKSLSYADQALLLAQHIDYKKGIATANNLKGFCFWTFGDNDLAIGAAMEALEIATRENYPIIQAESYYILTRGYLDLGEEKKSRESILKAEALAIDAGNWEQLLNIYNLKGVIFFIDHKTDSAFLFYNKAFEIGKNHAIDSVNFPRIISNIGECYSAENPVLAFTYFNRALAMAKETGNTIAEASITDIIGHAYLNKNDIINAEANLQAALQLARNLGLRRVIRHAYAGLVDIKLKQGKGDEAVVYLRRYYAVRDSLVSSSKIRQIVELESKHELQLKEQNVKILENEKRIQTIWKNLLIVLVIFLVFLSAGIYWLQQYRYSKNREMLNLEIDYLTQQHRESVDKYKASLRNEPSETLESYDQKLLKKAISIVDGNITDPQFGVEKMAIEMNMSRTNLHRKIKSITGFPPSELIRSIRLRKAANLIVNKVDTVTQIAMMAGFDDYSHFSKAFKKHFGVAPSGYEEQHRAQLQLEQELNDSLKNG
jgi:AraC-like DNA-binding protein